MATSFFYTYSSEIGIKTTETEGVATCWFLASSMVLALNKFLLKESVNQLMNSQTKWKMFSSLLCELLGI